MALWAQLSSVVELASGVALAGVGTGIAVYVARTSAPARQLELLREALRLGLAVAFPVALGIALAGLFAFERLFDEKLSRSLLLLGAAAGWLSVIPGTVNAYWLGQQRRARMLALAVVSALLMLAAAAFAPRAQVLAALLVAQALPALVVLAVLRGRAVPGRFRARAHPLRRYLLPGLAIGLLSPASTLLARWTIGEGLSWHDAGVIQALWRISDWVCAPAAGVLSVYFLPRFAAARASGQLAREMRRAALVVLVPSAALLAALYLARGPLLALLYGPQFAPSAPTVALLYAGGLARIAAWIPLFALYAARRTGAIALGEWLSLPLFAALLLGAGAHLSLELAAAAWLGAYAAYLAFNLSALRPSLRPRPLPR